MRLDGGAPQTHRWDFGERASPPTARKRGLDRKLSRQLHSVAGTCRAMTSTFNPFSRKPREKAASFAERRHRRRVDDGEETVHLERERTRMLTPDSHNHFQPASKRRIAAAPSKLREGALQHIAFLIFN